MIAPFLRNTGIGQLAKNEAGLNQYQVRDYRAWYAHATLAMLAAAYLAAPRAQEAEKGDLHPAATMTARPDRADQQRDPPAARHPRPGTRRSAKSRTHKP
jgi:hypothetical protein